MPLAPDEWSFKEFVRLDTSPPWKWESGSGKTLAFDSLWPPKFPEFLQVEKKWMILAISFSKPFVVLQALYAFSLCSIFPRLKKPSMFDWYLCIYMYTHTHLYMCIMCVYIYVYTYIHTRIRVCIYILFYRTVITWHWPSLFCPFVCPFWAIQSSSMDMGMRTVHCAVSLTWLRATCQGTIVLAFSSVYVVLLVVCSAPAVDICSVCSPCFPRCSSSPSWL